MSHVNLMHRKKNEPGSGPPGKRWLIQIVMMTEIWHDRKMKTYPIALLESLAACCRSFFNEMIRKDLPSMGMSE